jgi:hypothetical protein
MRILLTLLLVLLTATVAQAGMRINGREVSRQEEVGIYCSVCMGIVLVPLLSWLIIGLVSRWLTHRRTKPAKRERKFQPPEGD